jgi:hypothetical protein
MVSEQGEFGSLIGLNSDSICDVYIESKWDSIKSRNPIKTRAKSGWKRIFFVIFGICSWQFYCELEVGRRGMNGPVGSRP